MKHTRTHYRIVQVSLRDKMFSMSIAMLAVSEHSKIRAERTHRIWLCCLYLFPATLQNQDVTKVYMTAFSGEY